MGGDRPAGESVTAGRIYGTVVYLAVVVLLEEDRASAREAIEILLATAFVFWLAHVYAHLVPRVAAAGRLSGRPLVQTATEQIGILLVVVVPVIPLALAALGAFSVATGYTVAEGAGLLALGAFAVLQARASALSWARSIGIALLLLGAGVGLVLLELSLH